MQPDVQIHRIQWSTAASAIVFFLALTGCRNSGGTKPVENNGQPSKSTNRMLYGTVEGNSMVPNVYSQHRIIICQNCKYPIRFQSSLDNHPTICPNCSSEHSESITRSAKSITPPPLRISPVDGAVKRWMIVAIQSENGPCLLKRLVGLPGEKIELKNGDLIVDGVRTPKPPTVQNETQVTVFDSKYSGKPARFYSGTQSIRFPITLNDSPIRLRYQNLACYLSRKRGHPEWVKDHYGFNQNLTRSLNFVSDFGVQIYTDSRQLSFTSQFETAKYGVTRHSFKLNNSVARLGLLSPDSESPKIEKNVDLNRWPDWTETTGGLKIEVWQVDGLIRWMLNDRLLFETPIPLVPDTTKQPPEKEQIQIVQWIGSKSIERIRVVRDLYFFQNYPNKSWQLGNKEIFVLGDNVPASLDSRHWHQPVTIDQILGTVEPAKEIQQNPIQ